MSSTCGEFSLPLDQIICGDNVETMATFPDACIDLVVTSPPYDNLRTYSAGKSMSELWDFEGVAQQLWRVIKPGGVVVWVVADATIDGSETGTSFRQALRFKEIGFRLHDTMIWDKGTFTAVGALKTRYAPVFEFMFVLVKGCLKTFHPIKDRQTATGGQTLGRLSGIRQSDGTITPNASYGTDKVRNDIGQRFNIWRVNIGGGISSSDPVAFDHPAIFPEALARDHILSWSNEGEDIVLDPFNGSGTTTKMAREMGRRYIGIDINEEYCEIAKKRLAQGLLF